MIYIIVPTFAKVNQTQKFIASIDNSIRSGYLIILVDDHPENLTFNFIKQNKFVKILKSDRELWWVGSINLGIKFLYDNYGVKEKDIVVFANNDVEIDKTSFKVLKNEMLNNINQIIHPRTFDQNNVEVSSGAKIITLFPYITKHPKNFISKKIEIDMGTARFLMMGGNVLNKLGFINRDLVQYGGDNDFTLSAKQFHNINTYILRDAICRLDDSLTGIKNHNIQNIKELYNSFSSIKSPNNIKYRYELFKKFFGKAGAFFITASISFNTIIKFIIRKNKK
ncbi:glycosyltransferase [Gammaproteobacteria bacterium]|nr:glycosyltransferase [Gammaproteobacteria bacterium]